MKAKKYSNILLLFTFYLQSFSLSLSLSGSPCVCVCLGFGSKIQKEGKEAVMKYVSAKLKEALLLWLHGFKEACRLHRVLVLCLRSFTSISLFSLSALNQKLYLLLSVCFIRKLKQTNRWLFSFVQISGGSSRKLLRRTGQCFLLNGFLFLGR